MEALRLVRGISGCLLSRSIASSLCRTKTGVTPVLLSQQKCHYARNRQFEGFDQDPAKLAERYKNGRHVTTAAMKHGVDCEPLAAGAYCEKMQKTVNVYPCGIIVSPFAPWLGATPDRKVYNPQRQPCFGILEIKCPVVHSYIEVAYLEEIGQMYRLKRNHNYYYQILMQLAVTGLEWCDFFVYCLEDSHMEVIVFDQAEWDRLKATLDRLL